MKRLALLSAVLPLVLMGPAGVETAHSGFQDCRIGASAEQRQRCDEEASKQLKAGSETIQLEGGWRLVRTKNPASGAEAISVMHVVDSAKSDFNLAGLSFRCGQAGIEGVLVVLTPLPLASSPAVVLTAGASRAEFTASVIQKGEALLLPGAASTLAAADWQNKAEVSVDIATKPNPISGIVPIKGLSRALRYLSLTCSSNSKNQLQ